MRCRSRNCWRRNTCKRSYLATLYIKITEGRFYAKNLDTNVVFDEPPVVVYKESASGSKTVLAVGKNATDMTLEEGFKRIAPFESHQRVLVGDFETAQAIFKYAVRLIAGRSLLGPRIIVHIDRDAAGDVAQVESRAFIELAEAAGARDVKLLTRATVAESGMGQSELEESLKKSFG